jgi:hypothetical protein
VVKYDNGLCHAQANKNLVQACSILGVDLHIEGPIRNERGYILNSTKALSNLGVFFTACFSCHYTILSVVYKKSREHNLKYQLVSTNHVEKNLANSSHGFMLRSLLNGFFKAGIKGQLKYLYYATKSAYYLVRLKWDFDRWTFRFLRNLGRLHPIAPRDIAQIVVSDYVAWDFRYIEKTLREELKWDTPRRTKVPYFRFDCHFSSLIDESFKKATGTTEHALLTNWFVQAGYISKEEVAEDFQYMNDDERVQKEKKLALEKLNESEA